MRNLLQKPEKFRFGGVKAIVLTFLFVFSLFFDALASIQSSVVTLNVKNVSVKEFIGQIQKSTKLDIVYISGDINLKETVTYKCTDKQVTDVLKESLLALGLNYKIQNETITIFKEKNSATPQTQTPTKTEQVRKVTVKGKLLNKKTAQPVAGATIIIKGTLTGAISDDKGAFVLTANVGQEYEVTFIGMKLLKGKILDDGKDLVLRMEDDIYEVEDVVVTGLFTRKLESFTGSAATYSAKQLKQVGGVNILQSLRTLDPTFVMLDSKTRGSDPNTLPNIEIRGTTSIAGLKTEFGEDPNRPLFILDGIESSLSEIINLNMDRVASITVLKDAASTAIYGSKAANGVIVVETVQPKPGKLRLSYNGSFDIQMPDLSDYNLMNSREKLEFERVAGIYKATEGNFGSQITNEKIYYDKLKEIESGVDSYWMSEPIRTVANHSHNINIDGGDQAIRYGLGVNYNGRNGVMKGSQNSSIGANFTLSYRRKNIIFTNRFSTSINSSKQEPVTFNEYAKQNPYYRKYNDDGSVKKVLGTFGTNGIILNPMYIALQEKIQENKSNNFANAFSVDVTVLKDLRVRGRVNISQNTTKSTSFVAPTHPSFDKVSEKSEKGSYSDTNNGMFTYDGDLNLTYGKLFAEKHQVNLVGGWNFNERVSTSNGYSVRGFVSDKHKNPQFSAGFKEGQRPNYSKSIARSTSFYMNANYSFKNRYLVDGNFRADATSRFGSDKLFSPTWAVGLGWNLHNEAFMKNISWMTMVKFRGSIGNPGNQNFDPYMAYKTYLYNVNYQNFFGPSAIIEKFGNPSLKWQRTLDKNIGFDMAFLYSRLRVSFDYYTKKTDPMLMNINIPISTGATSLPSNLGGLLSTGASGSIFGVVMTKKDLHWSVNYNFRFGRAKYVNIESTLASLNKTASDALDHNKGGAAANLALSSLRDTDAFKRYYDGSDPNDIYSVRSMGIDPATGREVFLTKSGELSFVYKGSDEVKIGNSRPDIEGVIGSTFSYKGFNVSINVRYSFGADVMASALYQKVESIQNDDIQFNQDKRALYDRWKNPGDIAKFSSFENSIKMGKNPISSRFLVAENTLSFESISFGYETSHESLRKVGLSGMNINVHMNNIARISSLKEERGLDYPFARTIAMSIGLRF